MYVSRARYCLLSDLDANTMKKPATKRTKRVEALSHACLMTLKRRAVYPKISSQVFDEDGQWPKYGFVTPKRGLSAVARFEPFFGKMAPDVGPLNMRVVAWRANAIGRVLPLHPATCCHVS